MYTHSFNQDLNQWDISNVSFMDYMFYYDTSFYQELCWSTSSEVSMVSIFDGSPGYCSQDSHSNFNKLTPTLAPTSLSMDLFSTDGIPTILIPTHSPTKKLSQNPVTFNISTEINDRSFETSARIPTMSPTPKNKMSMDSTITFTNIPTLIPTTRLLSRSITSTPAKEPSVSMSITIQPTIINNEYLWGNLEYILLFPLAVKIGVSVLRIIP